MPDCSSCLQRPRAKNELARLADPINLSTWQPVIVQVWTALSNCSCPNNLIGAFEIYEDYKPGPLPSDEKVQMALQTTAFCCLSAIGLEKVTKLRRTSCTQGTVRIHRCQLSCAEDLEVAGTHSTIGG